MVPAAPPTWKNQRTTSWPAPISAIVPYHLGSRLIRSAFWWVSVSADLSMDGRSASGPRDLGRCGPGIAVEQALDHHDHDPTRRGRANDEGVAIMADGRHPARLQPLPGCAEVGHP